MKKSKSKRLLLAALAGLLILAPVQSVYIPMTVQAGQIPDTSDSRLSDFDIAPGTLNPAFSPDVFEYTATVDANVTGVSVRAIPRSSNGTIASVEGARSLQPGVNTIKVTCSAQDFSVSVYTITVTVGSAGGTQQPDTGAQQPDTSGEQQPDTGTAGAQQPDTSGAQQPDSNEANTLQPETGNTGDPSSDTGSAGDSQPETESSDGTQKKKKKKNKKKLSALMGTVASDGTVTLNGAAYRLSSNFSYGSITQDIPSAFGQGSVQIGGTDYSTLYCEEGGIHLVYMENTDGNGSTGFYYYDEVSNAVERFKYMGTGDNFVVWISTARSELPAGYQETTLELPSGKEVAAYQNLSFDEMQDYYLIYGIYSGGSNGWYLFDNAQKTYLRYINAFAAPVEEPEEEVARTVSLVKYNSLNEKYTQLKKNNVRIVSVLAVAIVLMIIIFTAILLRSREEAETAQDGKERTRMKKTQRLRRVKQQAEPVSKSSLAAGRDFEVRANKNAKKITKTFTKAGSQKPSDQTALGQQEDISSPEEIRAQVSREQISAQRHMGSDREQRAYERRRIEQQAYEQKVKEQQAYEQKLKEQQAYEQKIKEQQAYEQKLKEQQAYEQKLKEQQAYERRLEEQRAYAAQSRGAGGMPQKGILKREQASGSTDSVQLAAEKMRQSMKFTRKNPMEQQEHDPMDDWEVEEPVSRRAQKSGRKKRGLVEEDMEIMDLNDL